MNNKYTPITFFVLFWCFVVLILLNVLIALILEIYSSVEPEVNDTVKKEELSRKLVKIIEGIDGETLAERFSEVRQKLEEVEERLSETSSKLKTKESILFGGGSDNSDQ